MRDTAYIWWYVDVWSEKLNASVFQLIAAWFEPARLIVRNQLALNKLTIDIGKWEYWLIFYGPNSSLCATSPPPAPPGSSGGAPYCCFWLKK